MAVIKSHGVMTVLRSRAATHLLLGLAGLFLVGGAFWSAYSAVVGVALDTLGELSSAAIVWLFLVAWVVLWVALEMVVERAG